MREDEEFEVVRSLISTPWPEAPEPPRSLRKPVTFREIDGQELARQYVAHRELAQTEALEQEIELPKPPKPGVNRLGDYVPEPPPAVQLRGGLFSWARRLFTARGEN